MSRQSRRTFAWLACVVALSALSTVSQSADDRPLPFAAAPRIMGQPRERGLAYGKHFAVGIRDFLDNEVYPRFIDKPAPKEKLLRYAAACGEVVRDVCPMIAEEFAGIADGAGLTFDEIILINLHEELYHRGPLPKLGHCTAVAIAPSDSGDGHTYVGQTWDWMVSLAGKSALVEWRREGHASVLAYGYPGMPMGAGVNSAGIALCWTSAALNQKGRSPRVGLPSYALIAHLLAQNDLDSVIREVKRDKHAGWFTFVIADAEGNLVNVEGSPTGVAVERVPNRLARVGFGTREMSGAKPGQPLRLHARCEKMYDLLQKKAGKNDRATLQRYFSEPEHGIVADTPGNKTIDMMIFETTMRKAYVSRGPKYRLEWREFELPTTK